MAWTNAWPATWPVVLAAAIAGAWPVTAYAGVAWLLPSAVVVAAVAALIWRRPAYGVAVTLALLPLLQVELSRDLLPGLDNPLKPIIGGLIVATVIAATVRGHGPGLAPSVLLLMLAAVAFATTTLASALVSTDPGAAPSGSVYLVVALLLFFATTQVAGTREDLTVILAGAVSGLLLAGAEGLAQHFAATGGKYGFWSGADFVTRVQGSFGHPSLYATYLMLSIPVAAALAMAASAPRRLRTLSAGAVAAALPALYFTYTRGAIVALGIGALLWLAIVRPRLAAGGAVLAVLVGIAVAPSALGDRFSTYRNTSSDAALLLRTGAWNGALAIFSEHPVAGVGVGSFPRAYAAIPDDLTPAAQTPLFYDQLREDAQPWHAHNVYLTVLAEVGILGLLAFSLLVTAIMLTVLRATRVGDPVGRVVCVGIGCSAVAWAVHGLVDYDSYWVSLPMFAFIGIAAAQVGRHESSTPPASAAPAGPAAAG